MATKDQREKAWDNAKKIRGKEPDKYRQDPYGNAMYKPSYGKSSEKGWEVDHIKPQSKDGSDATRNLQALNTSVNRSKGDDERKKSRHSKSNK
jgi:5-methylcytosine-specific restriction endonuclease McrA